ncbi:hypothetical protein Ddye_009577 [Dipteronia dyeriana]|uniref:Uncharacterized protein n=1 Tax=Dipteronia dyeriana TaxID=168575 RepID=A0AAD9XBX1_9ROSI|nr:hypothetical protein Ddye_009577 [Dipteronia dyeriana]
MADTQQNCKELQPCNPQLVQMIQGLNREIGKVDLQLQRLAYCGQGPNNVLGLRTVLSNLCHGRDQYTFWYPFHPSEKANKIIVQ